MECHVNTEMSKYSLFCFQTIEYLFIETRELRKKMFLLACVLDAQS